MMIECPRCGFAQPKDQYCASCGVNIDQILAKPKPFLVRLLQNPNFHLSLIGLLVAVVVGWIFYTQSALVSREVGELLDLPVASRNAADPEDVAAAESAARMSAESAEGIEAGDESSAAAEESVGGTEGLSPEATLAAAVGAPPPGQAAAKATVPDPQKLELSFWEIPRESLATLMATAQRLGESNGGRAYYWPQNAKVLDTMQTTGQSLAAARTVNLQSGGQVTLETPPTAPEMFQFALILQITKFENKEAALRWAANFVLPQSELPGETGPTMRAVLESSLAGNGQVGAQGVVMLLMDPPNRTPREEYVLRAGDGPWAVFSSPEFRAGITDWVMLIQLK